MDLFTAILVTLLAVGTLAFFVGMLLDTLNVRWAWEVLGTLGSISLGLAILTLLGVALYAVWAAV